jgi:hypothetical protein
MIPKKTATPADGEKYERRIDGPAEIIDEAVVIATVDGVGPAIERMSDAGVAHQTALRVLSSPAHHREVREATIAKVLSTRRRAGKS